MGEYITVITEDHVGVQRVRKYVLDAVSGWGGQYHPDDPFFGDNKRVHIVGFRKGYYSKAFPDLLALFKSFLHDMDFVIGGGDTVERYRDKYEASTGKRVKIMGDQS